MQQKEMDTEDDVAFECINYDDDDYYTLAYITVKIMSHVLCFSSTKASTNWRS